ncbi:hypothetical protein ACQKWADRAFT_309829 [Trichoderma austrokoningii]
MAVASPGWFAVPPPVRELFKRFPLTTLPADALPERSPEPSRPRPRLYVFARTEDDARSGRPSFNPQCLKWQTFLRIAGVEVDIVPSTNHASPSGALPFLLPPTTITSQSSSSTASKPTVPLTGSKIERYAKDHSSHDIPTDSSLSRIEAYEALLSQSLRPAWLHTLYLNPLNTTLLKTLYLPPSPLLQLPSLHALRNAATAEILKTTRSAIISPDQLLSDVTDALRSLSALLADDEWFFGRPGPGLFDAELFAYTYLILDAGFGWLDDRANPLAKCVAQFDNLVEHRTRLYESCWSDLQREK